MAGRDTHALGYNATSPGPTLRSARAAVRLVLRPVGSDRRVVVRRDPRAPAILGGGAFSAAGTALMFGARL